MTVFIILCALLALAVLLLAPGHASKAARAPFEGVYFAHRGLHTPDRSVPENSAEAFRRAVAAGYGVELDVHLTADRQVVVFHDDTLDRVCGVSGRVEDRTLAELRALSLCGTEERIPLFSEVLEILGKTPVVVELKTGGQNRELCEKTYALLREYDAVACIESFDPTIVRWFRKNAPELLRGQLATEQAGYLDSGKSPLVAAILSNTLLNVLARPQFIAYHIGKRPLPVRFAELLGAMKVGWTAHSSADEAGLDAVIFEFYRP